MKHLYIIRGLPGSGKSSMANKLASIASVTEFNAPHWITEDPLTPCGVHIEADQFFHKTDGTYRFDKSELPLAHKWCQSRANELMKEGRDIAVSNTFSTNWEMDPYIKMADHFGYNVFIIECQNNFGSIHNVPEKSMNRMRDRWEEPKHRKNLGVEKPNDSA